MKIETWYQPEEQRRLISVSTDDGVTSSFVQIPNGPGNHVGWEGFCVWLERNISKYAKNELEGNTEVYPSCPLPRYPEDPKTL